MHAVPLREAGDAELFGGKAVQLGQALRAGLPVPDGVALAASLVDAIAEGNDAARRTLLRLAHEIGSPVAVRSSAVGEDGTEASFAGQHVTKLNVHGADDAVLAVVEVWQSGRTESALGYRAKLGHTGTPQIGVVLQKLVHADVAGVLFTANPVSGRDEIVIEAAWGLGEAIVQGMVIPDRIRMEKDGAVIERLAGLKDIAIRKAPGGGTFHEPLPPPVARRICLGYPEMRALHRLARNCDQAFGEGPHDLEWAIEAGELYLLQRRPITRRSPY